MIEEVRIIVIYLYLIKNKKPKLFTGLVKVVMLRNCSSNRWMIEQRANLVRVGRLMERVRKPKNTITAAGISIQYRTTNTVINVGRVAVKTT